LKDKGQLLVKPPYLIISYVLDFVQNNDHVRSKAEHPIDEADSVYSKSLQFVAGYLS
jgi:hypothetical protein